MKPKIIIMIVSLAILFAACASTEKMTAADRERIVKINIDSRVTKPGTMLYTGPGSTVGVLFGAVGGIVTALSNILPGEKLKDFSEKNNILIERIALEEVTKALKESGRIPVENSTDARTGRLSISVLQYGFSVPNGFSTGVVPVLMISAELHDSSGKSIWKSTGDVSILDSNSTPVSPEELYADPLMIDKLWREAAKEIARTFVAEL